MPDDGAKPQDEPRADQAEDQAEPDELESSRMPFLEHLEELRTRLTRAAIAVGVLFLAAFAVKEQLYAFLAEPLKAVMPPEARLIYTAPAEAFFTYIKVSFLAALVASSPVIFWQLYKFIAPGLYSKERRMIWPFVITSSALFMGGAVFCYKMVFPYAFEFFMSFATTEITPMLSLKEYLSFSTTLLIAFGVIFEMPLVLVFLGRLGVVNSQGLRKKRKYAILLMFVMGALFTPPDVVTQCMMAGPLIILYEVSIWLVRATEKKKARRQAEFEAELQGEDAPSEHDEP